MRRRLRPDQLLKEIAGSSPKAVAKQLLSLSSEVGAEIIPRHNSVSVRLPRLDRSEQRWLTLFVVTTAGTFYCSWLDRWKGATGQASIAKRYQNELESAIGRVVFHPGEFRRAVPLTKLSAHWPRIRLAVKRAVRKLRRALKWRAPRDEFADTSDIEGLAVETRVIRRGRSGRLRREALRRAAGVCSVCRRDFGKVLHGKGARVLQVHHIKQLSATDKPRVASLADLTVVCANCHMLLHLNPKRALQPSTLRAMLQADLAD